MSARDSTQAIYEQFIFCGKEQNLAMDEEIFLTLVKKLFGLLINYLILLSGRTLKKKIWGSSRQHKPHIQERDRRVSRTTTRYPKQEQKPPVECSLWLDAVAGKFSEGNERQVFSS